MALDFLAQGGSRIYGTTTASLDNGDMKGDNYYPKDIPVACKHVDEFRLLVDIIYKILSCEAHLIWLLPKETLSKVSSVYTVGCQTIQL